MTLCTTHKKQLEKMAEKYAEHQSSEYQINSEHLVILAFITGALQALTLVEDKTNGLAEALGIIARCRSEDIKKVYREIAIKALEEYRK